MSMIYDIKGKTILVTGANRGIGKALVEGFLKHGAKKVYAAVRTLSSADPLVEMHGRSRVIPIYIDLQQPRSIAEAANSAGDVQVVVNNAGVLDMVEPLSANAMVVLQYLMEVNAYGLIHMAQQFVPILERNGGGSLVQINSTASLKCSHSSFFAYSASKHASFAIVLGLKKSLKNTLVVSVHPGPIATDMVAQFSPRVPGGVTSEPAFQVADAIIDALRKGTFLVYPDTASRALGKAYESFAADFIDIVEKTSD